MSLPLFCTNAEKRIECLCAHEYIEEAKYLLEQNPGISITKKALYNKHTGVVDWLLDTEQGITALSTDSSSNSIAEDTLIMACAHGQLLVAQKLLRIKPSLNMSYLDDLGFRFACQNGHLEIVQWLVQTNPSLNMSVKDEFGFRLACAEGQLEVAQWLLLQKPNINIGALNNYAFHFACAKGHLPVVQWLIQLDPTLLNKGELNKDCFHIACSYQHVHVAQWFVMRYPTKYKMLVNEHGKIIFWEIAQLPSIQLEGTIFVASSSIETCPICYERQCNILSNCNHAFCQECIEQCYDPFKCPYCRRENCTFRRIMRI